mgnify:CR=1 FL=1
MLGPTLMESDLRFFIFLNQLMLADAAKKYKISDKSRLDVEDAIAAVDHAVEKIRTIADPKVQLAIKELTWAVWRMVLTSNAAGVKNQEAFARRFVEDREKKESGGDKRGEQLAQAAAPWRRLALQIALTVRNDDKSDGPYLTQQELAETVRAKWADPFEFSTADRPKPPKIDTIEKYLRNCVKEGLLPKRLKRRVA